jgi:hypothetical protein
MLVSRAVTSGFPDTFPVACVPVRRFTGGRRQNNTGAMKQLNYKYDTGARPQTAPMKRGGMTGTKLKGSSTRPMAFEEA